MNVKKLRKLLDKVKEGITKTYAAVIAVQELTYPVGAKLESKRLSKLPKHTVRAIAKAQAQYNKLDKAFVSLEGYKIELDTVLAKDTKKGKKKGSWKNAPIDSGYGAAYIEPVHKKKSKKAA